jgi:hypothetical protein
MPRDPYIREKFTLEPMFLAFGLGPVSEGVEGMGNENSDAQNNQKCSNDFKHRRILRDLRAVKKIIERIKFPAASRSTSSAPQRNWHLM